MKEELIASCRFPIIGGVLLFSCVVILVLCMFCVLLEVSLGCWVFMCVRDWVVFCCWFRCVLFRICISEVWQDGSGVFPIALCNGILCLRGCSFCGLVVRGMVVTLLVCANIS